jgi:hypothetical protein
MPVSNTHVETDEQREYRRVLDGVCTRLLEDATGGRLTFAGDRIVSIGGSSTPRRTPLDTSFDAADDAALTLGQQRGGRNLRAGGSLGVRGHAQDSRPAPGDQPLTTSGGRASTRAGVRAVGEVEPGASVAETPHLRGCRLEQTTASSGCKARRRATVPGVPWTGADASPAQRKEAFPPEVHSRRQVVSPPALAGNFQTQGVA